MTIDFDLAYRDAISARDEFNKKYKDQGVEFARAGEAISQSLDQFLSARDAFENGDVMGGSAAVLRGIGALAGVLGLAGGPIGAAVGALLAVITGVIAAILEALRPASESLEAKLERLLAESDLKNEYTVIDGYFAAWKSNELIIDSWAQSEKKVTWEEMNKAIEWNTHYQNIVSAFSTLDMYKDNHSKSWLPLFDLGITYALHFWVYLEAIGPIVTSQVMPQDPQQLAVVETPEDALQKQNFYKQRQLVATELGTRLRSLHYYSLNEVAFHSLWLNQDYAAYTSGTGSQAYQRNSIMYRVGVLNGPQAEDINAGESVCFALANGGTFFSVGSRPYTLYVGRRGVDWYEVPPATFGGEEVDQVAIGELGGESVMIAVVHGSGRRFSICRFDDQSDTQHETTHHGWTAGAWRFGPWFTYDMPDQMTILAMAVKVLGSSVGFLTFALNAAGDGTLYDVGTPGNTNTATVQAFAPTTFGKEWLSQVTWGIAPAPGRSELSPCTISCVGDDIYLQVGNRIAQRENGTWWAWDVPGQMGSGVQAYQGRAYADSSMVFSTNQGLIIRYHNPEKNGELDYYKDEAIQTIWFSKEVSRQALTARALIEQLTAAAAQQVDQFTMASTGS